MENITKKNIFYILCIFFCGFAVLNLVSKKISHNASEVGYKSEIAEIPSLYFSQMNSQSLIVDMYIMYPVRTSLSQLPQQFGVIENAECHVLQTVDANKKIGQESSKNILDFFECMTINKNTYQFILWKSLWESDQDKAYLSFRKLNIKNNEASMEEEYYNNPDFRLIYTIKVDKDKYGYVLNNTFTSEELPLFLK